MAIFIFVRELNAGLPTQEIDATYTLMAFDLHSMPVEIQEGYSEIDQLSDVAIAWMVGQLSRNIGDINTWIQNADGAEVDGDIDNATFLLYADNRTIIKGMTKTGVTKVTKTARNALFSFAFSRQFKAYVQFSIQSGLNPAGMVATVEADKVNYFLDKGIRFIRVARIFSHLSPPEQKEYMENLKEYKSQSGSDVIPITKIKYAI